jgi:hypothetical protein
MAVPTNRMIDPAIFEDLQRRADREQVIREVRSYMFKVVT